MLSGTPSLPRAALLFLAAAACLRADVALSGKVLDENNVAVPGARVEFSIGDEPPQAVVSDKAGLFEAVLERPGEYRIRAERPGFFVFKGTGTFHAGENQVQVTMNHLQEFAESIDVVYSPPAIDLDQPSDRKQLTNVEVLTVPYPAPHDLRNALPLFNGVVQDTGGRLHFAGGAAGQTYFMLDGFDITDPVTGRFETRINIDSVRSLELETARFSAEKGRGSAGSLDIKTKMGDDRWRFSGTNFVPGVSVQNGVHVNKWTPRMEISGPLARSRAWFHNGFEAFYDVDTIPQLPSGENRTRGITTNNLTRFQVNLRPGNILTGSVLANFADAWRHGLSFLDPVETTTTRRQQLFMANIKDQIYLSGGSLLEFGFSESRGLLRALPRGNEVFEISPFGRSGNYFVRLSRHTRRQQWIGNVFLRPAEFWGSHQVKFGVDFERESFHQQADRHSYKILRTDNSLARLVTFEGNPFRRRANFEGSHYVQDHWTPATGVMVEAGLRLDWDQVVRQVLWSPRFSVAWAPQRLRDTKIAAGFGVFYDSISLGTITEHQDQVSLSSFYFPSGLLRRGPVPTSFVINEQDLNAARYRTLSLSVERKLPFDFYGKVGVTRRLGSGGLTFVNETEPEGLLEGGTYHLRNWRHDTYNAFELALRRTFGRFEWSGGYTRSSSRSDAVVDYTIENPIFAPQGAGPFAWDTPHRFLMWGWAPVPKRLLPRPLQFILNETDASYLVEYRTGFPFHVVNEESYLVGPPHARRYPSHFSINLHFERKFRALHYLWAWRFGFNNITNNGNPNTVNNNIDSPFFLTYGRGQMRAFSVRLRLLGKR